MTREIVVLRPVLFCANVGALYSRVNAIKLPGGAEIDLSPDEKSAVAHEVATQAAEAATAVGADHEQVAQTTAHALGAALDSARVMKLRNGGSLDAAAMQESARVGVRLAASSAAGSQA
ncbi:MAG TPA: hypothetical protein VGF95_04050 [Solirubrobacteraceae bacterium]